VKDCGRAIALLMLADTLNHRTYNVSSGRLVRYSEVVAAINAAVPNARISLPEGRNPDRPPDNYLDTARLQADTGFRPEYDVERAVNRLRRLADGTRALMARVVASSAATPARCSSTIPNGLSRATACCTWHYTVRR
jgi:nucleoside-diphosphate-sugar epimerase